MIQTRAAVYAVMQPWELSSAGSAVPLMEPVQVVSLQLQGQTGAQSGERFLKACGGR